MNIAIITGASSGIGRSITEQLQNFYDKNYFDEVWVISRSEEKLKTIKSSFKIRVIPLNLQSYESILLLKNMLELEKPTVKVLINCAGFGKFGSYKDINLDSSLGMIDLNCKALVGLTEIAIPFMKSGSAILQFCSVASFLPLPLMNVYAASKAFVQSYSLALYKELKPKKIHVTTVCPSWVKTEFLSVAEKTKADKKAVKSYAFMLTPIKVANLSLKALKNKKAFKIPGVAAKLLFVLSKITPKRLAMNAWLLNCNKDLLK